MYWGPCRSIMLRQEELAFVKAISTMQLSPAMLKNGFVSAKEASGACRDSQHHICKWSQSPQSLPSLLAGKRKANELVILGDSSEPANRRPATGAGSAPLPAVTGEHAASCSRHIVSPEGGETYAAILDGSVAPFQPSGPLMPTAIDSDPCECAVSTETVNRRMFSDKSGPLSNKPVAQLQTPR